MNDALFLKVKLMNPIRSLTLALILTLAACGNETEESRRGEASHLTTPASNPRDQNAPNDLSIGILGKVLYSTESPDTAEEGINHDLGSASTITIELCDTSLMDAPSELIHSVTLDDVQALPAPFQMPLDGFGLELGRVYSLSAFVDADQNSTTSAGDLSSVWSHSLTDAQVRVITEETPGVVEVNIHVESF